MTKLSPKQKTFCQEYLVDLNGTQAAIRAGYSPKTANVQSSCLLIKPNVKAYVEQLQGERADRTGVTVDWVVDKLRELVEICMSAKPVLIRVGGELTESGEYKIDSYGAKGGLELLGKHLGMFVEKSEVNLNASGELAAAIVRELSRKNNGNSK